MGKERKTEIYDEEQDPLLQPGSPEISSQQRLILAGVNDLDRDGHNEIVAKKPVHTTKIKKSGIRPQKKKKTETKAFLSSNSKSKSNDEIPDKKKLPAKIKKIKKRLSGPISDDKKDDKKGKKSQKESNIRLLRKVFQKDSQIQLIQEPYESSEGFMHHEEIQLQNYPTKKQHEKKKTTKLIKHPKANLAESKQKRKRRRTITNKLYIIVMKFFISYRTQKAQTLKSLAKRIGISYSIICHKHQQFIRAGTFEMGKRLRYKNSRRTYNKTKIIRQCISKALKYKDFNTTKELIDFMKKNYPEFKHIDVSQSKVNRNLRIMKELSKKLQKLKNQEKEAD